MERWPADDYTTQEKGDLTQRIFGIFSQNVEFYTKMAQIKVDFKKIKANVKNF